MTITLLTTLLSTAGSKGQDIPDNKHGNKLMVTDTISVLRLKKKKNAAYTLLILNLDSANFWRERSKMVELIDGKKSIARVLLPSSFEVKNFSVDTIAETNEGFRLEVSWGGGNCFYGRSFYFGHRKYQFYLDSVKMNMWTLEPEKETKRTKNISPAMPISKFVIDNYISNE